MPANFIALTGQRFGRLLVLERGDNAANRQARWVCRCDCGEVMPVRSSRLRSGRTTSCGCRQREIAALISLGNISHGHSRRGCETPEYRAWAAMLQRCYNSKNKDFKHYGARGISVCPRWRESFQDFLADMGLKPHHALSIDRIDNDGDYGKENCCWATAKQQRHNQRKASR